MIESNDLGGLGDFVGDCYDLRCCTVHRNAHRTNSLTKSNSGV